MKTITMVVSLMFLALLSTGSRHAVAVWNGLSFEGGTVWRWKDRIDRRFVAKYALPIAPPAIA